MVLTVSQSLGGCNHNRFPRVYAHRIKIFHIADGKTVIMGIPDHFIFYFLPVLQIFRDKDLGRQSQSFLAYSHKLFQEYWEHWKEIEYEVVRDSHDNCLT